MRIKWHILQQEVEEKLTGSMTSFKKNYYGDQGEAAISRLTRNRHSL
jgi:hypothetical protein